MNVEQYEVKITEPAQRQLQGQKREEQIMAELIHHYTKDLKPGESRTLEFL